jgi:hypothetical protein
MSVSFFLSTRDRAIITIALRVLEDRVTNAHFDFTDEPEFEYEVVTIPTLGEIIELGAMIQATGDQ